MLREEINFKKITNQSVASCHPSTNESGNADGDDVIGGGQKNPTSKRDQSNEKQGPLSTKNIHYFACKEHSVLAFVHKAKFKNLKVFKNI